MAEPDRIAMTNKARFIPLDIIIDILSRIPGSSLIKLRLVCKLWRSLTYDARLINLQLDRASRVDPPRIILFSQDEEQGGQKFHLTLLDETWRPKYRLTRPSAAVLSTPPCNGLICLYDYHRNIKLCNPTTQEFLILPKPTPDNRNVVNGFPKCFFGFHPTTKEYKVVRFFYRHLKHSTESYDLGCEIFTLGTSSWRYISSINYYPTGPGINVHGFIYWTAGATTLIPDRIIVLDLKYERFRLISPPDFSEYQVEVHASMFLVQLEGNLCLVNIPYGSPAPMDIWMLKDYTNSVWIHRCRVPVHSMSGHYRWQPEPIIIHEEKILLRWGANLCYHSLQSEGEAIEKVYSDQNLGTCTKVFAFVESLVSLGNQGNFQD